ncbi:MAG: LCP family protein [Candidatus Saccharibacteria bacterium]|nr:LCP family protein [Candidatus Saccharibacteria bacterium]
MPKKKHVEEQGETSSKLRIVYVILIAVQAFMSGLLLHALNRLNLLQAWQFWLFAAGLAIFLLFNGYKLVVSRKAGRAIKIICVILALLISIGCVFAFKYVNQTISFIESVTEQHEYETITYQVRTLKKNKYKKISDLAGEKIGYITADPNVKETKAEINTEVKSGVIDYDSLGAMLVGIYEKGTPAAVVINQGYLELLEEAKNTFEDDTRVVYEFSIIVEKDKTQQNVSDVATEPFILYISGSDSQGSITKRARSDVNILAVVNPRDAKILLVNIPRDAYVYLHGITSLRDKLTDAGLYGIDMSRATIEDLLDIKINYTIKVGFETVLRVVDEIDGIEIESDKAYSTNECNFIVGKQTVNSTCALVFARTRKIYPYGGDRERGKNQQQMLAQIIQKISDPHYLVRYSKILKAAEGTFETSLTYDEITRFVRHQLNDLRHWSIESIQLDGKGAMLPLYTWGPESSSWSMVLNEDTIVAAQKKIAEYLK